MEFIGTQARLSRAPKPRRDGPSCTVCGKGADETDCLVALGSIFICADCVDLCGSIVAERRAKP